jgi:surface protein
MIGTFKLPLIDESVSGFGITEFGRFSMESFSSFTPGDTWTEEFWQEVYDTYQRPSEWLTLPTLVVGEQKIVMLHKVDDSDSNFCAFMVQGNYIVDWGDGSATQSYTSFTTATHLYDYNSAGLSSQTPTSFGYKQVIVTITPQSGQNLTRLDLNLKHPPINGVAFPVYSTGWLDIKMVGDKFTRIAIGSDLNGYVTYVSQNYLEMFEFVGPTSTSFVNPSYMFYNCRALRKVVSLDASNFTTVYRLFAGCNSLMTTPMLDLQNVTDTSDMFQLCRSIVTVPFYNLSNVTTSYGMFYVNYSLVSVPLFDLSNLIDGTNMFSNCFQLSSLPLFNLQSLVTGTSMFTGLISLESLPLFNLQSLVSANSMFSNANRLVDVPLFNLSNVTNASNIFSNCRSLESVPLFNLSNVTNASGMFAACYVLKIVPKFTFTNLTNAASMFASCYSLVNVPLLDLSNVTSASGMFSYCTSIITIPLIKFTTALKTIDNMFTNCYSLTTVPLLNFSGVTSASNLFYSCFSLTGSPAFDFGQLINASNMFTTCYALFKVPVFNMINVTNASYMFANCNSLQSITISNLSKVTDMTYMFYSCVSLSSMIFLSSLDTSLVTSGTFAFYNCNSLPYIPAFNFQSLTNASSMFLFLSTNSRFLPTKIQTTFDISNSRLSKISLEEAFTNLGNNVTSKTISIGGNWGADTPINKSCGTTIGSKTITLANTSSLAVGMYVSGTGISTPVAVTLQTGDNTITLNNHGLVNGKLVYLQTLVTTTGLSLKTPYYVVNSTTNTFQVSLTLGGSALTLTNDGTGTIYYVTIITAITTNANFTVDMSATATGTVTLSSRYLNTTLAVGKGWTVNG